jgi:hypothetical protein
VQFYANQEETSINLFNKVFKDPSILKNYKSLDFIVFLPSRKSLRDQTIERIIETLRSPHFDCLFPEDLNAQLRLPADLSPDQRRDHPIFNAYVEYFVKSRVHMFNVTNLKKNKQENMRWLELANRIGNSKGECLFLVFHDECHWGINVGGMFSRIYDNPNFSQKNVILIHISATIWNTARSLREQMKERWVKMEPPPNYTGSSRYVDEEGNPTAHMIVTKPPFYNIGKEIKNKAPNSRKLDANALSVIYHYAHALLAEFRRHPDDATEVAALLEDNARNLVVVRMRQSSAYCAAFFKVIRFLRNRFSMRECFDIVVDVAKDRRDFLVDSAVESELKFPCEDDNSTGHYSSLQNINRNCLLIILEKGRFGDTFPSNMTHFDVRSRYVDGGETFTTFFQDVGRAFGFNLHPELKLLLSQAGFQQLKYFVMVCVCFSHSVSSSDS